MTGVYAAMVVWLVLSLVAVHGFWTAPSRQNW
jgi:hypothetical protein